jgi:hypothetical protein
MNTVLSSATARIETLWRANLDVFGEPQVRESLLQHWSRDPNVAKGRIQLDFPPTFQPGYVGADYFNSRTRLVFLGYNPGEGSQPALRHFDDCLVERLRRFKDGDESLLTMSDFQARIIIKWPIYHDKGIFRETNESTIALLPAAVRPSVKSVALLNLFPFKTVKNKPPLAGSRDPETSMKAHMWDKFIRPTLDLLAPTIIVYYPAADSYKRNLSLIHSLPTLFRAWHPSDYNVRARRSDLSQSWQPLACELTAQLQ